MEEFNFDTLRRSWEHLVKNRESELKKLAPNLVNPKEIYIKRLSEDDASLSVQFLGFSNAMDTSASIPQAKRMIMRWIKNFSMSAQVQRSEPDSLIVLIAKELKFSSGQVDEALVSIFKRDPKTNKIKKAFRCVGGKKHGRKVSSPDACIGVPDFNKKMNFSVSKKAKYGQSKAAKAKTRLTNIVSKRVTKANARVKKARGF